VELSARTEDVNADVVRYLNRLSDLLFVLARRASGGAEPRSRNDAGTPAQ
jgi:cob(I)alamin adenosyltransferase